MTRLFHVRPSRQALLLGCLVGVALGMAGGALGQSPGVLEASRGSDQNPDERAAGGEALDDDDQGPHTGTPTLLLTPSHLEVDPGRRIRLTLSVIGADDLRRLPVTVRFDPSVVELVSTGLGAAWDGRPAPVFLHDASRAGELVIGIAQLDRDQPGLSGAVEVLELEFRALAAGDAGVSLERYALIGGDPTAVAPTALEPSIIVR